MRRIKAFISYAEEDTEIADSFKFSFEKFFGFDVFAFKKSLVIASDFVVRIRTQLKSNTDVFIVLVSRNSVNSTWINQEVGMALTVTPYVVPILIDDTLPPGFLAHIQGEKYDKSKPVSDITFAIALKIFFLLSSGGNLSSNIYGTSAVDSLIYALQDSDDFKVTNPIVETMLKLLNDMYLSVEQLEAVKLAFEKNRCVRDEKYHVCKLRDKLGTDYGLVLPESSLT